MIILDTSVWLAWLDPNDSQHAKAVKVMADIKTAIILPEHVLAEVVTVLTRKIDKTIADKFIAMVFNSDIIRVLYSTPQVFNNVIQFFQRVRSSKLSFVDIFLLYLAQTYQVVTFDKELQKALAKK